MRAAMNRGACADLLLLGKPVVKPAAGIAGCFTPSDNQLVTAGPLAADIAHPAPWSPLPTMKLAR